MSRNYLISCSWLDERSGNIYQWAVWTSRCYWNPPRRFTFLKCYENIWCPRGRAGWAKQQAGVAARWWQIWSPRWFIFIEQSTGRGCLLQATITPLLVFEGVPCSQCFGVKSLPCCLPVYSSLGPWSHQPFNPSCPWPQVTLGSTCRAMCCELSQAAISRDHSCAIPCVYHTEGHVLTSARGLNNFNFHEFSSGDPWTWTAQGHCAGTANDLAQI